MSKLNASVVCRESIVVLLRSIDPFDALELARVRESVEDVDVINEKKNGSE